MICIPLAGLVSLLQFLGFSAGGLLFIALLSEIIDSDYRRF